MKYVKIISDQKGLQDFDLETSMSLIRQQVKKAI
jgi:hypothetical protein